MKNSFKYLNISVLILASTLFFSACSDDGDDTPPPPPPTTYVISGTVAEKDSNLSIEYAQITVVNVETQQNHVNPFFADVDGLYSITVPIGNTFEVRVAAQGYVASPPDGVSGIPIAVATDFDVYLEPIENSGGEIYGQVSMQLVDYNNTVGALVILESASTTYSAITNVTGGVQMYNVLATDYNVTIKTTGHAIFPESAPHTITVKNADENLTIINNITLTEIDGVTVTGTVNQVSSANRVDVDVSLIDQITGKAVPGTQVNTVATKDYSITSVAPGSYTVRATYNIDQNVVDPVEPPLSIIVANSNITVPDIKVTGATILLEPIVNDNGSIVEINTTTPKLAWVTYPQAKAYIVEVVDANGIVVWGGLVDDDNNISTPPISPINTDAVSIDYAGQALKRGSIYRWKLYTSRLTNSDPQFTVDLISASEEAQGVFRVLP